MDLGSVCQQRMGVASLRPVVRKEEKDSQYQMNLMVENGNALRAGRRMLLALVLVVFIAAPSAFAMVGRNPFTGHAPQRPVMYDTIILTSGKHFVGIVTNISGARIYYNDTLGVEKSYNSRNIHKIKYSNGRTRVMNDKAVAEASDDDWRIVILTEDTKQVEGLYPRGMVYGESSPSNKTLRAAQRNAETRLKKRAVAKEGLIVLVTKRLKTGGYGEVPTYRIEGEVYGVEPLPEGEEPESIESSESNDTKAEKKESKSKSSKKKKKKRRR